MPEKTQRAAVLVEPHREIKVLVVDDHAAFRDMLGEMIAAAPGFVLAGAACSGEDALVAVDDLAPEIVLLDVIMPGMGGIAAARAILDNCPGTVVVLISVDDPALHPGATALGGAVACVRKQDLEPHQLRHLWEAYCN